MIDTETIGVVIDNCEETHDLMAKLPYGGKSVKRALQKYTVSLRIDEFEKALSVGIIRNTDMGVFVLADNYYYSEYTGLDTEKSNDKIV